MNKKIMAITLLMIFLINICSLFVITTFAEEYTNDIDEQEVGTNNSQTDLIITYQENSDSYLINEKSKLYYKWQMLNYTDSYFKREELIARSIASNGNISVAVGDSNLILRSEDNNNWKHVNTESFKKVYCNFEKVIWNGKMFLAFANSYNYYITSVDGKEWVEHPFGGTYAVHNAYQFNSKTFLVCSDSVFNGWYSPNAVILVSGDGIKWTRSKFKNIAETGFGTRPFSTMAYNGKFYLAAGNSGTLAKSTDGINWIGIDTSKESYKAYRNNNYELVDQYEAYSLEFTSLIWDGKRFVGSGIDSSGSKDIPRVITSKDGIRWYSLTSWDISKSSTKSNFELGWNGEFYYLTINSYEDVQPEVFNSAESCMRLISISISKDGSNWSKICEFKNDSAITTQIINKNFYIVGSSIYVGTKIKPDLIPENSPKISFYTTKLVKFPRTAYNIYSNPMGFYGHLCKTIDGKPLKFPKGAEPIAYKKAVNSDIEILYPVDIIVSYMNGKLVYDKKSGFYIAKYNDQEKFRIKPNHDSFVMAHNEKRKYDIDFTSKDYSVPRMYNGKIYMNIFYIINAFDYEATYDDLLGFKKKSN